MPKIEVMPQSEIFDILNSDMKTIIDQVTAYRDHRVGAVFPSYVSNGFANLSTTLYFYEYVKDHVKPKKRGIKTDLEEADLESLRMILADAHKKSASGVYQIEKEYTERNELLGKAFKRLCPEIYRLTGKFETLSKSQRRELTILFWGDPVYNFRFIHKHINRSTVSDKKKLKILKKIYGKRFVRAVGAAMCVEGNNSDCLAMLFDYMCSKKKKKRAHYIRAYAEAFKRSKGLRYFRIDQDFYDHNKRIIEELGIVDIGYKKAFKDLRGAKTQKAPPQKKDFRPQSDRR